MNRDIRPVRRLIEAGRYTEARVLLNETAHPGVALYLARLDEAERDEAPTSEECDWLPWVVTCVAACALVVLLLAGLNLMLLGLSGSSGALLGFAFAGLYARRKRCKVHPNLLPRSRSYRL